MPVGIVAIALAPRLVPESRAPRRAGLDLPGTALVTAGLTGLLLPLIEGRREGWPAWTWLCLAGAAVVLVVFARRQRALAAAGLSAQLVFWCTAASFFLVLALYLQDGRGLDPIDAGLVFTILAGAYLVASLVAPGLVGRHGRRIVIAGALALAAGYGALLAAVAREGAGGPVGALVPGLLLVGAGTGLLITPLVSVVIADVGAQWAGSASAALSTVQSLGNAIGVAVVGVVYFDRVGDGVAPAFEASLAPLLALTAAVLLPAAFLPRPARRGQAAVATAAAR